MSLTRKQILSGNYVYPNDLVKLIQTDHFKERLEERGKEIEAIPSVVRVSKDNIYCAEAEGQVLRHVVVRIKYKVDRYMFLSFDTRYGVLKTVWFKDYDNRWRQNSNQDSRQAVRDLRGENEVL